MTVVSSLRLARLQRGWTLDDLLVKSGGKLSPARLSRIERGLRSASADEAALLVKLLGVAEQTIREAETRQACVQEA
jgi:transcriptional regulator with XRE-family HTH domain